MKTSIQTSLPLLAICVLSSASAQVPPDVCTPGLAGENILPVTNGTIIYCVSDFGWSDTAFWTSVEFYDLALDVLSGDDAVNLRYSINGQVVSGTGWLSPGLDAGQTFPSYPTGSPWTVLLPVQYLVPTELSVAQSQVRDPNGLRVTITTSVHTGVDGNWVEQTYQIVNDGTSLVEGMRVANYFNYHPNGSDSTNPAFLQGTVTYLGAAGLTVRGPRDATWIADANLVGPRTDDAHDVGFADPADTIRRVENNAYNGLSNAGPTDAAGVLAWDFGSLPPGASATVTIVKRKVMD